MTIKIDFAEQHGGFERPPDGLDQKACPKCGGETIVGFGLMGGGFGSYVCCDGDPCCGWFYKECRDEERAR